MNAATTSPASGHVPVMIGEVLPLLAPRDGGIYVDGTFGAGGYTRAILGAAKCKVFGIDRDPTALAGGQRLADESEGRLTLLSGRFSDLKELLVAAGVSKASGVVLDIGVSSMQIDEAGRGFSFLRDGPLDMRMSMEGPSAADAVNTLAPEQLGKIIAVFGEETRARAIARSIAAQRPVLTTADLVRAIERVTGPQRHHQRTHPATKTFQALRIYVNQELDELAQALADAEEILEEGGRLVVVTFHSLEDRIVKRFFAERAGHTPHGSRHLPGETARRSPSFDLPFKGHLEASEEEASRNPRARSAKLRAGIRTGAQAWSLDRAALGVPDIAWGRH